MLLSSNYRSSLTLPNGVMQTPVSVGDLPSFDYQVSVETLTEDVTNYLEAHPDTPGVILLQDGKLHSVLPRALMFERLGHRYGIELFLRKPILELQKYMGVMTFSIASGMSVRDAVQFALQREPVFIYAPMAIVFEDGHLRLLDMHVLLYAQSHILDNANNVFGSMNLIEQAIRQNRPFKELMDMIFDSISRVVPSHRAGVFVKLSRWVNLPGGHDLLFPLNDSLGNSTAFKTVIETGRPVHLDNIKESSQWQGMKSLGKFRSWLGTPVMSSLGCEGVLSLGRISLSPFSDEEIQLAKTFSEYIGIALNGSANAPAQLQLDKVKRKTGLWVGI